MYLLTTTSTKRQALWERIFAMSALPIKQNCPRLVYDRSGNYRAYDLDFAQLHPMAVKRLAAYIAKETRQVYAVVEQCLNESGFVIRDDDTLQVIELTAEEERPSFHLDNEKGTSQVPFLFGSVV